MSRGELLPLDPSPAVDLADVDQDAGEGKDGAVSPTGALLVAAVEGCNVAVAHCVRRGGRLSDPAHLGRLVDGIELGQTAADLEERGSPLLGAQLEVCAAAFGRAAESCARFADDPVLAWCGQACGQAAAGLAG